MMTALTAVKSNTRLIMTPSVPLNFAAKVAHQAGIKMIPYRHYQFPVGESFSMPERSMRGKRAVVLSTINHETAADDVVRLSLIYDGLRRMDILNKEIHFVILNFPGFMELLPIFQGLSSLSVVGMPSSEFMVHDQRQLLEGDLFDLYKSGMTKVLGTRVRNINPVSLFAKHFDQFGDRVVSSIEGLRIAFCMSDLMAPGVSEKERMLAINYLYNKSGSRIVGVDLDGASVDDRVVTTFDRLLPSYHRLHWATRALKDAGARAVHVGIIHPTLTEQILMELVNSQAIDSVAITDSTGIPGEKLLVDGKVPKRNQPDVPKKVTMLSTVSLVAGSIRGLIREQRH